MVRHNLRPRVGSSAALQTANQTREESLGVKLTWELIVFGLKNLERLDRMGCLVNTDSGLDQVVIWNPYFGLVLW